MLRTEEMEIIIESINQIREAAKEFVAQMGENKVFAFYGKMGAGKTTFIMEDYVYSGNLCFMELPELIEDLLPEDAVKVMIEEEEDGRRKVRTLPLAPPC